MQTKYRWPDSDLQQGSRGRAALLISWEQTGNKFLTDSLYTCGPFA